MPWLEVDGTYHHLSGKSPLTPRAAEALRAAIRLAQQRYRDEALAAPSATEATPPTQQGDPMIDPAHDVDLGRHCAARFWREGDGWRVRIADSRDGSTRQMFYTLFPTPEAALEEAQASMDRGEVPDDYEHLLSQLDGWRDRLHDDGASFAIHERGVLIVKLLALVEFLRAPTPDVSPLEHWASGG